MTKICSSQKKKQNLHAEVPHSEPKCCTLKRLLRLNNKLTEKPFMKTGALSVAAAGGWGQGHLGQCFEHPLPLRQQLEV